MYVALIEESQRKNVKMEIENSDHLILVENQGKVSVAHLLKEKITGCYMVYFLVYLTHY